MGLLFDSDMVNPLLKTNGERRPSSLSGWPGKKKVVGVVAVTSVFSFYGGRGVCRGW